MTDTVTRLMELADDYADWAMAKGQEHPAYLQTRQALHDELVRLFTPLSDEQIEKLWHCPKGTNSVQTLFRICEHAHGIGGES